MNVFTEDGLAYCGRLYNNLQDFYDTDTYKEIGRKLWKEEKWGETFETDARYPYGISTIGSILKLETNKPEVIKQIEAYEPYNEQEERDKEIILSMLTEAERMGEDIFPVKTAWRI